MGKKCTWSWKSDLFQVRRKVLPHKSNGTYQKLIFRTMNMNDGRQTTKTNFWKNILAKHETFLHQPTRIQNEHTGSTYFSILVLKTMKEHSNYHVFFCLSLRKKYGSKSLTTAKTNIQGLKISKMILKDKSRYKNNYVIENCYFWNGNWHCSNTFHVKQRVRNSAICNLLYPCNP